MIHRIHSAFQRSHLGKNALGKIWPCWTVYLNSANVLINSLRASCWKERHKLTPKGGISPSRKEMHIANLKKSNLRWFQNIVGISNTSQSPCFELLSCNWNYISLMWIIFIYADINKSCSGITDKELSYTVKKDGISWFLISKMDIGWLISFYERF